MRIEDVMTRGVVTIGPDDTLHSAARAMGAANVGLLPVVEGEELVGVLTDRDIVVRAVAQGLGPGAPVREAMTWQVFTCQDSEPLSAAGRLMRARAVRRLVVVDADHKLVGVISIDDLASVGESHLAEELADIARPPPELR